MGDYLWGEPTAAAMIAVVSGRADRGKPLAWIEIDARPVPLANVEQAWADAANTTERIVITPAPVSC